MGNACGAGSSGAVREQRAKEGSAEQMCKRRGSSVIMDRKIKRHDVRQDYDLGKLLGEGAFGKVHAGTLKRSESEKAPRGLRSGSATTPRPWTATSPTSATTCTSEFGEEIKLSRPVSTLLNRDTRHRRDASSTAARGRT